MTYALPEGAIPAAEPAAVELVSGILPTLDVATPTYGSSNRQSYPIVRITPIRDNGRASEFERLPVVQVDVYAESDGEAADIATYLQHFWDRLQRVSLSSGGYVSGTWTETPPRLMLATQETAPSRFYMELGFHLHADLPTVDDGEPTPPAPARAWTPGMPATGLVGPDSVFAVDVTAATVDPASADKLTYFISSNLAPYYSGVAAFNVNQYNTALYTLSDPTLPRSPMGFRDEQGKNYVPGQLYKQASGAHFADWPLDDTMTPASGNDGHLAVYDPSTDTLWSAWRAKRDATRGTYSAVRGVTAEKASTTATLSSTTIEFPGWSAVWGGRIDGLVAGKGWFPSGMGTSASGLATELGSMGVLETQAAIANGTGLRHALSLAIIKPRSGVYSYPAQRTDGADSNARALMEGQRLRLKASYDVEASNLTPLAKVAARTAQTYGFLVTDKAGTVNLATESGNPFREVDPEGLNPWTAMMVGKPTYEILKGFPWSSFEVIAPDWGA